MRKAILYVMLCVLALGVGAKAVLAQAPAATPSVKAEFLRNYNDAADKVMRLADVVPAEKYAWKPTPEVRSFSAVFMHIAGAGFNYGRRVGGTVPADVKLGPGFDTSATDKVTVVATLKQSIEFVRSTVGAMSDADFEKTFQTQSGAPRTYRDVLFALASHTHEHLGQAIAYTRMAGMVPPWTEEQQQRQQQAPPKKNP